MEYTLVILGIALILIMLITRYLYINRKEGILYVRFILAFSMLMIHILGLILQIIFKNSNIPLIYFDYFTYIGIVFLPVFLFYISLSYFNSNIKIRKYYWVAIFPIISLIMLWTNDLHHLFYKEYSINMDDTVSGIFLVLHMIYTYTLILLSFVILLRASIIKSGFFSKQTLLIIIGGLIPLVANVLGALKIIPMTIYVTPILFIITTICLTLAIIKYKALNIIPIALRTIMDTMSDGFVVISKDGTIVDKNKTFDHIFEELFKDNCNFNNEDNLYYLIKENKVDELMDLRGDIKKAQSSKIMVTKEYHIISEEYDKYFETDIQPVLSKRGNEYIGTLLLFKDITQHKKDIKEIEEKQEIIVKQGQLVSIGELAGGMAHDINTPISAIKSGILMFREMLGKRSAEEMELLQRMDNCADKIIKIVNSMRNQIRNLGGDTNVEFKIQDVINDIKVLVYNELVKNNCELQVEIEDDLAVKGDPTKLGQVLTNLVVNAIQAYKDKGGKVEVILTKAPENIAMIKVIDYAGGMDESIKPYIFKNILTTKGTIGTGLGLYLAYSVIKGKFGGDITFATEQGVGTTFYVTIPRA